MPQHGDQYRETPASVNPFAPPPQRITEYTATEIAKLQSRLDRQLGPEYISTRPGAGGGKVHYLAAEKVINLANDVFGFNGWSSSIQNVQIDFCDEHAQTGKITLGLSTIVRVTLRDGTYHEDTGYGHIENCKGKAAAFEKCKKEAATDALKRALRTFGNMLGNCLYDKDYLQKVTKIKPVAVKWDEDNLHRHPDYAPVRTVSKVQEQNGVKRTTSVQSNGSAIFEDDFESNLFDDTDFTNDTTLSTTLVDSPAQRAMRPPAPPRPITTPQGLETAKAASDVWMPPPPQEPPPGAPQGFITSKAVDLLDKPPDMRPPASSMAFNPQLDKGIKHSHGVSSSTSAPIKLSAIGKQPQPIVAMSASGGAVGMKTDFVNPSADPNRRIGMPPNRSAYKPPSAVKRPALADVSNLQQPDGPDAKKLKVDTPDQPPEAGVVDAGP